MSFMPIRYWPGVLQTDEIFSGSVDVKYPRRGTPPGMEGLFPPFSELYHTALAETLLFAGRGVAYLARDRERSTYSGLAVVSSQLAQYYGYVDERGIRPPSALVSVKGILTALVPTLLDFAKLPQPPADLSAFQRFYFTVVPDFTLPLGLLKTIGGPPLTIQWPIS